MEQHVAELRKEKRQHVQMLLLWQPAWPWDCSETAWQHAEFGCMIEVLLLKGTNEHLQEAWGLAGGIFLVVGGCCRKQPYWSLWGSACNISLPDFAASLLMQGCSPVRGAAGEASCNAQHSSSGGHHGCFHGSQAQGSSGVCTNRPTSEDQAAMGRQPTQCQPLVPKNRPA